MYSCKTLNLGHKYTVKIKLNWNKNFHNYVKVTQQDHDYEDDFYLINVFSDNVINK